MNMNAFGLMEIFIEILDDKHIKHVKWCGKEDSDLYENKYVQVRSIIDERVGLKPPYEV